MLFIAFPSQAYEVGNLSSAATYDHYELKSSSITSGLPVLINYGTIDAQSSQTSFFLEVVNHGAIKVSSSSAVSFLYGGAMPGNASLIIDATSEVTFGGGGTFEALGSIKGEGLLNIAAGQHRLPTKITASRLRVAIQEGTIVR